MNDLYDRLNNLPESLQAYILSSVYGVLEAKTYQDDETAVEVLEMIERQVDRFTGEE